MKFSHSLQFNAVPEWSSRYISYSTLKKQIYQLERDYVESRTTNSNNHYDSEHQLLTSENNQNDPIDLFRKSLDVELKKIDQFYKSKELEIYNDFNDLIDRIDQFEAHFTSRENNKDKDNEYRFELRKILHSIKDDITEAPAAPVAPSNNQSKLPLNQKQNQEALNSVIQPVLSPDTFANPDLPLISPPDLPRRSSLKLMDLDLLDDEDFNLDFLSNVSVATRRQLTDIFVSLSELKSYIELNKIGFSKALKKFDKALLSSLKQEYLNELPSMSYIFKDSTLDILNTKLSQIIQLYALIEKNQNIELAKNDLRSHLREHIVWERNTVWRDMIGLERKTQAAFVSRTSKKMGDEDNDSSNADLTNEKIKIYYYPGKSIYLSHQFIKLSIIIFITAFLLVVSPFENPQERNCFSLLICASLLWATESIPLYTTSLLVPFLIVLFRVLKDPITGEVLPAPDASKYIFSTMWSSIIMLLLGGFTLAAALSKYNIDKFACTWILSKAGTNPKIVLLVIMGVSLFASMWVSNVAAPVLMYSVIQPVLRTLPEGSEFTRALIIGIALACNVAGMASPISSPQNLVGIQFMDPPPSWVEWFIIALPISICCLIIIWIFLLLTFDIKSAHIVSIRSMSDSFNGTQIYITGVCILTIILWCLASKLEFIFGEMGVIAIIPIIAFYGPGLLTTQDINNYPWNIVLLAMGGLALGKAVTSAGLLNTIAKVIQSKVEELDLWSILLIFGLLVLVMATFVSHTVAALIIVPLVAEIGSSLPDPHPRVLVMAASLLCSCAMGLPTSGFPNVTAICMLDKVGVPYLTVNNFISRGVPSSFFCYFIVVTVGYIIMKVINF